MSAVTSGGWLLAQLVAQTRAKATATIKLTCGASSIEMTPGMITVTSPMIKLN